MSETAAEARAPAATKPDAAPDSSTGAPPATPPAAADPPPADRPAWLAEKFKTPEDMAKAYGELETWKGTKQDALKAEVLAGLREGVPKESTEYAFTVPDGLLPEGFKADIPQDDPFLAQMKTTFHELGAKPEQFQAAAEAFLKWQVANMPDLVAERAKLGEGAPDRLAAVDSWLVKTLPDKEYHALASSLMTAEGITGVERLMKLASRGGPQGVPGSSSSAPSLEQAQAAAQHPAYRADTPEGATQRAIFADFIKAGGKMPGFKR